MEAATLAQDELKEYLMRNLDYVRLVELQEKVSQYQNRNSIQC
jgi:hypothetical protein